MAMKKRMVIGVDISDLKVATTGQKTFLAELCNQFNIIPSQFKFIYFSSPFPVIKSRSKFVLLLQHLFYQIWKQTILPIKAYVKGCDVLFCSDYFVPFFHLGFKTVQVFHDAFFFENPEQYNKYWFVLHKYLAMPAARKSSIIVVPSDYALQKVHQLAGIPLQKLIRIYEAPKSLNFTGAPTFDPILAPFIQAEYIFHVGVMEKRKNILQLIKAFNILINSGNEYEHIKLVLAGKGTGRKESDDSINIMNLISDLNLTNKVFLTGYLSDAQLKTTYENALAYVFPSLNEGFGIPVLEAFKSNIPVLVANNSCLPEIGGDAVISFDPLNELDICEKMKMVIDDASLRNILIEKGNARLLSFSWEQTAIQLLDVFANITKPSILMLHNTYLYKGGEETVVDAEIASLKKNGYNVLYKEYNNARFGSLSFKTLLDPLNTIFNMFSFLKLIYFIRAQNIKVVHAHNIFYTASPSVFWAAKIAGAKTIMTIHNYRLFCLSANFFRDNQNCFNCNTSNSFKQGIQNKCFKNSKIASATLALSIRFNEFIGTWKNKVDFYIVLNEFTKSLFIDKGVHPDKIILKANFLATTIPNNEAPSKSDFYLFAGRLTEEKGIKHLIEAFSHTNRKLVIAGNGDLVNLVSALNMPNIQFLGLQNKEQIKSLMCTCKALIFPSIWIESMPMTLIEAQSFGTIPIVASSINTNKMINNGVDGFLYTSNSATALNEAITHFESLSPKALDTIATNAKNKFLKHYGESNHIKKIAEIYGV
jgi:glycosyltransferase involved in cell wall biosynthesis